MDEQKVKDAKDAIASDAYTDRELDIAVDRMIDEQIDERAEVSELLDAIAMYDIDAASKGAFWREAT